MSRAGPADPPPLAALGLRVGDRVRFRSVGGGTWREGRVAGRAADGSITVIDAKGAARALRPDRLEVAGRGPRGGRVWEPVTERAARTEQLGLW